MVSRFFEVRWGLQVAAGERRLGPLANRCGSSSRSKGSSLHEPNSANFDCHRLFPGAFGLRFRAALGERAHGQGALAAVAADRGIPVHVDAAQSAEKTPINVGDLPVQLVRFHGEIRRFLLDASR